MEDGIKHEIMIERNIECDGNIVMASGKIVRNVWFNPCSQLFDCLPPVYSKILLFKK